MRAYVNTGQSCYADSVLVAMFSPTSAFDFMTDRPTTPVSDALADEIRVLDSLDVPGESPATCCRLRHAMGARWCEPEAQSAVDFMHALFDACSVTNLGTQDETTERVYTDAPPETSVQSGVGFRIHTVVVGTDTTLLDAFVNVTEPGDGRVVRVTTTITPTVAPVLVFEVARMEAGAAVGYSEHFSMGSREYSLVGVVCMRDSHYFACVHVDGEWWLYDDTYRGGKLLDVRGPEEVYASVLGEIFIYVA